MKKQILLPAFLILATVAMAQSKPSFGIRGGLTSSSIKGDAANSLNDLLEYTDGMITTKSRTGFYGGVNASIPLSASVSLEPGLYYTQKGYEMNGALAIKGMDFLGANARASLASHYIDLPLLIKGQVGGFQVFGGPQVSYLAKADLKTTAGVLGFNLLNKTMDATDQLNRWDAGLTGGIGYQFNNGVNITAAYDHGLTKTDANRNMDAYNRSFKVGLGFKF